MKKDGRLRALRRLAHGAAAVLVLVPAAAWPAPVGRDGATVEKWADGLAGPQGLARDGGDVYVVENGAGRVTRFSSDGRQSTLRAEGLQAPAWAVFLDGALYVSERRGNSVARIGSDGSLARLPGDVVDPLGLAVDPRRPTDLLVVSHRQSLIHRFAPAPAVGALRLDAAPAAAPPEGAKYGWRDIAVAADGTLYVTDEVSGAVLRRPPGQAMQVWVTGLKSPSGLAISPAGEVYVTEEGGGRLSRLEPDGKAAVIAEGLGTAREALFLDERTLLVSDRAGGAVWKVTLRR